MKVLQELLELFSSDEILEEELGNLNIIDKKFRPLLKQSGSRVYNSSYSKAELVKTATIANNLGRDVIVEDGPVVKTAADLHKTLTDREIENRLLSLVILTSGTDQFGLIKRYVWARPEFEKDQKWQETSVITKPGEYRYELFIDTDYLAQNVKEESEVKFSDMLEKSKFVDANRPLRKQTNWRGDVETVIVQNDLSESALYGQLTVLFKLIKETSLPREIKTTLIFPDKRRLITHRDRTENRRRPFENGYSTMTRAPGETGKLDKDLYKKDAQGKYEKAKGKGHEYSKYFSYAKTELNARLEQFKIKKSPSVEEVKELIEKIKEVGFPKFFKLKGMPYKLKGINNVNYDNLTGNSSFNSYVEFTVDDDSPEYEAVKKRVKTLREMFGEGWESDPDYERALAKFFPPRTIKLKLGLGPGGIIVTGVMGKDEY